MELRKLLAPMVTLKDPFRWSEQEITEDEPTRLKGLVSWELVLAADHVNAALRTHRGDDWTSALPDLLDDFQRLLRDALDLLNELGEANDRSDGSYWDLPSITPHWQNRGYHDWTSLIELLRDAWLSVYSSNRHRAMRIAQAWFDLPYPTFKRLALFAASQDNCIPPDQWVKWLLTDNAWWLWSTETGREAFRLLVTQGRQLAAIDKQCLEAAILSGPPRKMYRDDLEPGKWQDLVTHSIWLRLAKLKASVLTLGESATARLTELSIGHPQWKLTNNESDEFSHWMSGTGDPDWEDHRVVDIAPRKRLDLVQWLRKPPVEHRPFHEDTWREVCRTRFFHSLYALCDLSREEVWPAGRWREALQTWAEQDMVSRSWQYAAPLLQAMPVAVLQEIAHAVTWWMEAASKTINRHEDILLGLCQRLLALPLQAGTGITSNGASIDQPVTEAINHPVGHVTQALINLWFKREPNDNDLLPAEIAPLFTQICDVQVGRFRHGRVLLGSHLIALFRVDRRWTEQYLLPVFAWGNTAEAKAVWEGFLWSPRIYQPLLTVFKPQFLETANHYGKLGEHSGQFAAFLTYASLGPTEGYSAEEFRSALGALPQDGLERSVQTVVQALEGAADQREDFWKNRVQPFWQQVWPQSRELATSQISESLTRLMIAAGGEFPTALDAVQDWLRPIEDPHYVVSKLHESGLCKRFPAEALRLLSTVVVDQQWASREVGQCLDEIADAEPNLAQDARYKRLRENSRRYGI